MMWSLHPTLYLMLKDRMLLLLKRKVQKREERFSTRLGYIDSLT